MKEKRQNEERRLVIRDCGRAMNLTVLLYAVTELLGGLLTTYTATVLGSFADAVFAQNLMVGRNELLRLLVCIFLLSVVYPLLTTLPEIQMFGATLRHERMAFGRFLDKKYSAVRSMDEGSLGYLISNEATEMRIHWTIIGQYLIALPFLTAYLLYSAFRVSVIFTFVVFAISLLKLAVPVAVKKWRVRYDKETRDYQQAQRNLEVMLTGQAYQIRLFGIQNGILSKLSTLYDEYYENVLKKSAALDAAADGVEKWLDTFCVLLILCCGVILAAGGRITVGVIAAMYGYFSVFDLLISYVQYIVKYLPILNNIFDKMETLYQDLEEEPHYEEIAYYRCRMRRGGKVEPCREEITKKGDGSAASPDFARLDCENLSFSYSNDKPVLTDVNLSLRKGEKLLIEGENGSGKTTLFRILCGLEDGFCGKVKLNGVELNVGESAVEDPAIGDLNAGQSAGMPARLRRLSAVVERDDYLFEGTVRENVWLGAILSGDAPGAVPIDAAAARKENLAMKRSRCSAMARSASCTEGSAGQVMASATGAASADAKVNAALEEMGILHLADRMVGADHKNLSGGEQKRVAIARALVRDAQIFFLDEPDNGLDADTREWLRHWLSETDKTVVLISHDPEMRGSLDYATKV